MKIGDKVSTYNSGRDIIVIVKDLFTDSEGNKCFDYEYNGEQHWQYCDEAEPVK